MPTIIDDITTPELTALRRAVYTTARCRDRQTAYFASRSPGALAASKDDEQLLDETLADYLKLAASLAAQDPTADHRAPDDMPTAVARHIVLLAAEMRDLQAKCWQRGIPRFGDLHKLAMAAERRVDKALRDYSRAGGRM